MPPSWSVVIRMMRTSPPIFMKWLPGHDVQRIGERQRVRIVRRGAAVAGAVDANQTARNREPGRRALAGDAGVGDRAAQVEDDVLEARQAPRPAAVDGAAL